LLSDLFYDPHFFVNLSNWSKFELKSNFPHLLSNLFYDPHFFVWLNKKSVVFKSCRFCLNIWQTHWQIRCKYILCFCFCFCFCFCLFLLRISVYFTLQFLMCFLCVFCLCFLCHQIFLKVNFHVFDAFFLAYFSKQNRIAIVSGLLDYLFLFC
jgi:hypothetical protein